MLRIRIHGRGGQGVKTAGRILGSALFREGFEVQDSPRYGAERRGAPIAAYVRASHARIDERGTIERPDLVLLADDTLLAIPSAGVTEGVDPETAWVIRGSGDEAVYRGLLGTRAPLLVFERGTRSLAAECGVVARMLGVKRASLEHALDDELAEFGPAISRAGIAEALDAHEARASFDSSVQMKSDRRPLPVASDWIALPLDPAAVAAPAIHRGGTSVASKTGLWRTHRPVVDAESCHHCHWICGTLCPDGVMHPGPSGVPEIDLEHCKGCLICVVQCPWQAIHAVPEEAR